MKDELQHFLIRLGGAARGEGLKLVMVGGPVRDLLLGMELAELDLLVEGDAILFTGRLIENWNSTFPDIGAPSRGHSFKQFGTIKLKFSAPVAAAISELDLASARTERYPRPGRAPEVKYPCTIAEDLARRDFSINAIALETFDSAESRLIDPFNGQADIAKRVLRVLHERSFADDPARILRGLRFKVRFGFEFDDNTAQLLGEAIEGAVLNNLTPQRRFDEFLKALNEENIASLIPLLERTGVLRQIHPEMIVPAGALPSAAAPRGAARQAAVLGMLLPSLPDAAYEKQLKDWGLSRKLAAEFVRSRAHVV